MDAFIKVSGGIIVSLILYLVLAKQGKDISILLSVAVCIMVFTVAASYIKPVVSFLMELRDMGNLDSQMLSILCKVVGIGLLSEIVGQVCADAGNGTMGKTLQVLSGSVILWLSLPLFTKLMELVKELLVAL